MFLLTLTPLEDGSNGVNPMLPVIQLHSHPSSRNYNISNEVRLGRKGWTTITDADLPRKLMTVKIDVEGSISLILHKDSKEHSASLNGVKIETCEPLSLKDGAILSLLGSNRYQYRLSLKEDTIVETSTLPVQVEATTTTTTTTHTVAERRLMPGLQQACEELMCPVCMDILNVTVALNPCGHLFCSSCRQTSAFCPTCRTPSRGSLRLKAVDSLILQMVKTGSFSTDDAKYFLNRSGNVVNDAEMECIMKAGVRNDSSSLEDAVESASIKRRRKPKQINLCYAPYHSVTNNSSNSSEMIDLT